MAGTVDLPQPISRPFEMSPETVTELKTARSALTDWRFWLKVAVIVGAPLWIYAPVFHGGWLMDDDFYLAGNSLLNDPHRLWKAWFVPGSFVEYYPIHESFQWAQWKMWGSNTFGYHLTNVLLHALSSLLVWRLLGKFHLSWAWVGGLLFAIHPTLVESVVWIAELKNTLSLPPFLLAMCFLIEYENHHRPRDYYFALTAYVIAMLCKISMAPFPAAILLYAWWRRGRLEWKDVRVNLPFWGAAFFLTLLSIWCGQVYAVIHRMDITFTTGGVPFRIAIIGQTLAFYLATCLWPFGLQPMYVRWPLEHPTLLQFLPWPMTAGAIYWFWINRTTWGRHALLGFGFFCLFIAPFLGVVIASYMRLTWVMDHFVYIAIIGLIGLVVAGLEGLSRRYSRAGETLLCTAVAVSAVGLAISSHWYSGMFVDQTKLWNYAIVENPKAYTAYNNLGAIIIKDGQYEKALAAIDKAIEYYPDYFEAHYNRGLALQHLGRPDEALQEYRKATELSPASTQARLVYAGALEAGGDPFNAIHQYEFAAEENPDSAEIHAALGALLIRIGRIPDAAHEFSETVRIDPNSATSHNDLGNALYLMGQREAAIDEYQEALRFNPNLVEAHNNLGGALQEAGQFDEAVKEFDVAVSLAPTDAKLIANLATAVLKAGHRDEAIKLYELALHYDPTNDSAREDLAIVTGKAPLPPPPLPPAAQ